MSKKVFALVECSNFNGDWRSLNYTQIERN